MLDKLKKNYFLLVSTFLFLYFFFNLIDGERGLISYYDKNNLLNTLKQQEIELKDKIDEIELKNSLLSEDLDLDYMEILIREHFVYGKKDEKLYIVIEND